MKRYTVALFVLCYLTLPVGCVRPIDEDNRDCPCGDGWRCCEGDSVCVEEGLGCPGVDLVDPTTLVTIDSLTLQTFLTSHGATIYAFHVAAGDAGIGVTMAYQDGNSDVVAFALLEFDGSLLMFDPRLVDPVQRDSGSPLIWHQGDGVFYTAWVQEGSTDVVHLASISPDGTLTPLGAKDVASGQGPATNIDLSRCDMRLVVSGTVALAGDPSLGAFVMGFGEDSPTSGADDVLPYQRHGDYFTVALGRSSNWSKVGSWREGLGYSCLAVVTDRSDPPVPLGSDYFEATVAGHKLQLYPDEGIPSVQRFRLGKQIITAFPGSTPQATADGDTLYTLGIVEEDYLKLQGAWFECTDFDPELGCQSYMGVTSWTEDFLYAQEGASTQGFCPVALAMSLDNPWVAQYAITRGDATGGELVFGAARVENDSLSGIEPSISVQEIYRHRWDLTVPVPEDLRLVATPTEGWYALWMAEADLYLLPLQP